jgi:transcriptional regulator with XRE-family HTH domain
MGTHAVQRGATARTVRENVKYWREKRNLGLRGLAKKLDEVDRKLTHSAIDQIEKGTRRVDVDDLMALAAALEVSPITLLMPADVDPDTAVAATGARGKVSAKSLWDWLSADYPLRGVVMAFWGDSWPTWEREELEKRSGPTLAALMDVRAPGDIHGDD